MITTARSALRATAEAVTAVAAVQVGGLVAWLLGSSHGCSLTVAGTAVQGVLAVRWLMLRARCREACRELVIAGEPDRSPLRDVARECRRLRSRRFQARLAAGLEGWAALGARPNAPLERHRPIYTPNVIAAVAPQLADVAARVRAGGVELRGVAFIDRLLTAGGSPLYGKRIGPLREHLARARQLLG